MEDFGHHEDVGEKNADLVTCDLIAKYCKDIDKGAALKQKVWHQKLSRSVFPERELPNIFSYVRNASSYLGRASRQACSVLYSLGIGIIGYILFSNFYTVAHAFVNSF